MGLKGERKWENLTQSTFWWDKVWPWTTFWSNSSEGAATYTVPWIFNSEDAETDGKSDLVQSFPWGWYWLQDGAAKMAFLDLLVVLSICSFSTWGLWGKELLDCFPVNFHSIPIYYFSFPDAVIYISHRATSHVFDSIKQNKHHNPPTKLKIKTCHLSRGPGGILTSADLFLRFEKFK